MAGFTFAMVNIPQAMANALLAGVNPVLGLYTLMAATPIGALFTGSVFMNISTTSTLSVAAGDAMLGVNPVYRTQNMAVLVLLVGLVQLLAGLFRFGSLLRFVSNSVMVGFATGVALLIILGQIGDFTGYKSVFGNKVLQLADLMLHLEAIYWPSLILSSITLAVIVGLNLTRLRKLSMLIALLVATLLAALAPSGMLPVVGDIAVIPEDLVTVAMPAFSLAPGLLASALAIAIIGLVQGASVSQSYANPDGRFASNSRDFVGQGLANMATSFVQGIPAGGSMSGTALTVSSGAKTRWANIFAGLFVIPLVMLLGSLINKIPMAALAALLIYVGFQSLKPHTVMTVWRTGQIPRAGMVITLAATLILPLQYAVFVGVGVSMMLHIFRSSNKVKLVELVVPEQGFPIEQEAPKSLSSHRATVLMSYGSLFFAAAPTLEKLLPDVGDAQRPVVILIMRGRDEVGSTFIALMLRYARALQRQGGMLMLAGVSESVREQLQRTGTLTEIGDENVFLVEPQLGLSGNKALDRANLWLASGVSAGHISD